MDPPVAREAIRLPDLPRVPVAVRAVVPLHDRRVDRAARHCAVQAAIAHGMPDAVRAGDIPREKADDLGIICSVWLDSAVVDEDELDHKALFDVHREATAKVIRKAMRREPTIDWLLENQDKVTHYFHDLGLKREL
jgi:formaldehyde-activating enzyme